MTRVFYSPTNANKVLVRKLAQMEKLRGLEFIPLSEDKQTRHAELSAIEGRVAYIWGDGTDHDDSYYFTRDSEVKLKGNVDHHDDTRDYADGVTFYSHMTCTRRDGIRIITPRGRDFPERFHWDTMKRCLSAIREKGALLGENEMALTIDLDAIGRFPANPSFLYDYGFTAKQVIQTVTELRTRLFRLDVGGVKTELDDFQLIDVDLSMLPKIRFVELKDICLRRKEEGFVYSFKIPKEHIDLLGSYALATYAGILDAFYT